MTADVETFLRRFWLELWNERAMPELLGHLDPAFLMQDRRNLSLYEGTRDDWRALSESWWEFAPDVRAVDLDLLAAEAGRALYAMDFAGPDTVSGGDLRVGMLVINRLAGTTFLTACLFDRDDHDAARAYYDALERG